MTANAVLTSDDIEELESASHVAEDPLAIAAQLREAAEQGRVADPDDVGYAYLLAAEIYDREDALDPALALVDSAIAAYQRLAGRDDGWPRAYRGELLFRLGQPAEAMAELTGLRDRLTSDELAASYVTDALSEMAQDETAVEWLTAALDELTKRHGDRLPDELVAVVEQLAITRHRLREELELPHDDYDELADSFLASHDGDDFDDEDLDEFDEFDELDGLDDGDDEGEPVLLWWPREEFATVAARWPAVAAADASGGWEEQRQLRQALMVAWGERGLPALEQVTGSADEFATFLAAHEQLADADEDAVEAYTLHLAERGDGVPVPPGRNDPCWCRSGEKYKKCCLPRARG